MTATQPFVLQVSLLFFLAGSMSIELHQPPHPLPLAVLPSIVNNSNNSCCRQKAASLLSSSVHREIAQRWQAATALSPPGVGCCPGTRRIAGRKVIFALCSLFSHFSMWKRDFCYFAISADCSFLWKHWQIIVRMYLLWDFALFSFCWNHIYVMLWIFTWISLTVS